MTTTCPGCGTHERPRAQVATADRITFYNCTRCDFSSWDEDEYRSTTRGETMQDSGRLTDAGYENPRAYDRTATAYHRIAQHQDVIGSWVVFDPTGRDMRSCLVVGRIEAVTWDDADDGTADGFPRPLLTVVENGTEERWSVTRVEAVLRR